MGEIIRSDLETLLSVARLAARFAADVHRRARQQQRRGSKLDVGTKSSPLDLVTEVDREAERQLVAAIRQSRPDDAIIGEEGADVRGSSGVCWVLDPLDGTTNFVYGYPAHAVSVGVEIDGKRALGVVHDTFYDRVYTGIVGVGAECDGQPIAVRSESSLSRALLGTGFLPDAAVRRVQGDILKRLLPLVRDVRRTGCPSLDLCAVAAGQLDAFYESGLGRWDISAGAGIAEAAGATVVEFQSTLLPSPVIVVANARLAEALSAVLVEAGAVVEPRQDA